MKNRKIITREENRLKTKYFSLISNPWRAWKYVNNKMYSVHEGGNAWELYIGMHEKELLSLGWVEVTREHLVKHYPQLF